jgi:hypothetical protein
MSCIKWLTHELAFRLGPLTQGEHRHMRTVTPFSFISQIIVSSPIKASSYSKQKSIKVLSKAELVQFPSYTGRCCSFWARAEEAICPATERHHEPSSRVSFHVPSATHISRETEVRTLVCSHYFMPLADSGKERLHLLITHS